MAFVFWVDQNGVVEHCISLVHWCCSLVVTRLKNFLPSVFSGMIEWACFVIVLGVLCFCRGSGVGWQQTSFSRIMDSSELIPRLLPCCRQREFHFEHRCWSGYFCGCRNRFMHGFGYTCLRNWVGTAVGRFVVSVIVGNVLCVSVEGNFGILWGSCCRGYHRHLGLWLFFFLFHGFPVFRRAILGPYVPLSAAFETSRFLTFHFNFENHILSY